MKITNNSYKRNYFSDLSFVFDYPLFDQPSYQTTAFNFKLVIALIAPFIYFSQIANSKSKNSIKPFWTLG